VSVLALDFFFMPPRYSFAVASAKHLWTFFVMLLAGLVINVLQTVTQLHEPVVGLVPRLVAVLLVLLAILPWLVGRWVSFTVDLIGSIPDLL